MKSYVYFYKENFRVNIKIAAGESIGYCEIKKGKP